jgi:hypothetical protein
MLSLYSELVYFPFFRFGYVFILVSVILSLFCSIVEYLLKARTMKPTETAITA